MISGRFHHFGVPSRTQRPGEMYIPGGKVHVTDPSKHPYGVEFVRFDADSPMPEAVKTRAHAAFVVPNLEAALKGQQVLIPPFDATERLRAAFIIDGEAVIELLEEK